MQVIGEPKHKQHSSQMMKSSSLACAKKLSEHEALSATLKSIVRESLPALTLRQTGNLTIVEFVKRVFFGSQNGASFLVTFSPVDSINIKVRLRKKSDKLKIEQIETPNSYDIN